MVQLPLFSFTLRSLLRSFSRYSMADRISSPEPCYGSLPTGREVNTTVFCRDRNCSSHGTAREPGSKALPRPDYGTQLSSFSVATQSSLPSQSEVERHRLVPEDPESYGTKGHLGKGTLPASSSRWSPRHLFTQVRTGQIKRKSCILFILAPLTIILAIIVAVVAYVTLRNKHQPNLNVDVGYTQYKGIRTPNGIDKWFGMRYAAPPLGDLRFRAPQDPLPASKQTAFEVSLPPLLFDGCLTHYSMESCAMPLHPPTSTPKDRRIVFSSMFTPLRIDPFSTRSISSSKEVDSMIWPILT